jgi:uncharacterized protein GlcG (DUF336 family)
MTGAPTLAQARTALDAAIETAKSEGVDVAAVVVDGAGDVVALYRMAGTYPCSAELATKKAYGALNFRAPTHVAADSFPPHLQLALIAAEPRVTFLQGGVPLSDGSNILGAVGVSGGTGEQDLACCQAAVKALEEAAALVA